MKQAKSDIEKQPYRQLEDWANFKCNSNKKVLVLGKQGKTQQFTELKKRLKWVQQCNRIFYKIEKNKLPSLILKLNHGIQIGLLKRARSVHKKKKKNHEGKDNSFNA